MTRSTKGKSTQEKTRQVTTPIAVIGIGSIYPQANGTQAYWDNILRKVDTIVDVPESRWSIADYYDPNPSTPDKSYCKRGAFIPDIDFDPMEFGLPPNILEVTDVSQLLGLVVARDALEDAGYGEDREFDRTRTGCIVGFVGTSSKLFTPLMTRLQYPVWEKVLVNAGISEPDTQKIIEKIKLAYVNWEENSFPGAIGNVVSGRICNRFDLGGTNCVVDAACASSLAAVRMSVAELIEGRADMMLTGGIDTDNSINSYMCFSKTPAFTKKENVRTFDAESGGMMVGEGLGMLVLKRLEDAERDGDTIYAVIKAIGTSSDGRFKSIYAPRPTGQALAIKRAYEEAGFEPSTVGLIEAHGTGTMAGDPAEFQGLNAAFSEGNPRKQHIALGSVKSQIAHTKAAAGAASLIKASLALHHKVLPPTINVTQPNPKLGIEDTPFYLNTETRPWIRRADGTPRRAGVSSFGFGGTNFHVVLEEYTAEQSGPYRVNSVAQPILLWGETPDKLLEACRDAQQTLKGDAARFNFVNLMRASRGQTIPTAYARVGFVAENADEAAQALQVCIDNLSAKPGEASWEHPKGIYYRKQGMETDGKVVALFSGQGSQYLEMGRELAINFPVVREAFSAMDGLFERDGLEPLSSRVYPRPVFDASQRDALSAALTRTEHAQPAIGTLSLGLYKLLQQAGFKADFVAGHSFGELTALWAAGVIDEEGFFTLAKARGKAMAPPEDASFDAGTMTAVKGEAEKIRAALQDEPDVTLANWNANDQVVIAGTKAAVASAEHKLNGLGFKTIPLPVSGAFHTPLVGHAQEPFAKAIQSVKFQKPKTKVYSNNTAQPHSSDPKEIQARLAEHILNPVLFRDEIENIYAAGGTIFVEFGPKNVLTNLVSSILAGKPHLAVALNASAKKDSDRQLREAVAALRVAGLPLENFDPYQIEKSARPPRKKSPVTVKLNGGYYVSEKTRSAFEKALNDGFCVSLPQTHSAAAPQPVVVQSAAVQGAAPQTQVPEPFVEPAAQERTNIVKEHTPMTVNVTNPEQTVAAYQSYQSESVRLHEKYLNVEESYARAFVQMTELQSALVSRLSAAPGEMQSLLPLFESLERSMSRFHEHQAETLHVHQRYMETQERFTQAMLSSGASLPAARPAAAPAVAAPQTAVPQPAAAPSQPVVKNGNGNGIKAAPQIQAVPVAFEAPVKPVAPAPAPAPKQEAPITPAPRPVPAPKLIPVETKPAEAVDGAKLTAALLQIVSDKTGYPAETLELDMDMEADLGIDSIKRVEILGAMQTEFPGLPQIEAAELAELRTLGQIVQSMSAVSVEAPAAAVPAPAVSAPAVPATTAPAQSSAGGVSVQVLSEALLQVVSDKTGYPAETLELDMDMEADLGIDSIKRVEILGAIQEQFPELPQADAATLAELRTLGDITNYLSSASPSPEVTEQRPFDGRGAEEPEFVPGIEQGVVIRRILPPPDSMDFELPENHVCLITDDGTPLTPALAQALLERGWPVVALRLSETSAGASSAMPEGCRVVVLEELSETVLTARLEEIAAQWGPVGVFVHLELPDASREEALYFSEAAKSHMKLVFLAAKHLKESLNRAAKLGRAAFMTVTRLDGEFGLGEADDYAPVSGGLFGLVKTLNLEWEAVFCRALDISPALDTGRAVECILAELQDPNRLIAEVGYTPTERSTLAVLSVPVTGGKQ